ncbi:HNH endonuclease [Botrimarina hoheduenensis]|uniref:HNH nuclease domain-containing protein n=1 Tax=Botrimarina hoheduenensis TaxID=2528000 RepID=A0A5C5VZ04_9BACT|nr:HNH endonuclease [Botrimarina hoheduenensis]TWT42742.1 hypothetical protein Pla111_27150 [Botrimarina hoheduenensis]
MSISRFFTETLGANLANARWAWGATNPVTNEVFLRVWADEIESTPDGERSLLLNADWSGKSAGFPERARHVEAIRAGAVGYGVVCTVKNPNSARRKIKSFDNESLLRFGGVIDEGAATYGVVAKRIPVAELRKPPTAESTLILDLKQILRMRIEETEKERLANARVGQGRFRSEVLARWGGRCCVTGVATLEAVRASHIKPWRDSDNQERLDPANGLPLVATTDALFDAGLITFDPAGRLMVSERLPVGERQLLRLEGLALRRGPDEGTQAYMAHHREKIFR